MYPGSNAKDIVMGDYTTNIRALEEKNNARKLNMQSPHCILFDIPIFSLTLLKSCYRNIRG